MNTVCLCWTVPADIIYQRSIINTLPDKGLKIQNTIRQIDELLKSTRNDSEGSSSSAVDKEEDKQQENNGDSAKITKQMSKLNISSSAVRKQSIERANALADRYDGSRSLLAPQTEPSAKTKMLRMDESVRLQEAQQQRIKEEKLKRQLKSIHATTSESLADDLSLTLSRMKLDPEMRPERPQDDQPEDDDDEEDDLDSIDAAEYLYDDDDEGFDEEEYHSDGRH